MDATLWKRVSKMERIVERMEEMREERESVRPAIVSLPWGKRGKIVGGFEQVGWMRDSKSIWDVRLG